MNKTKKCAQCHEEKELSQYYRKNKVDNSLYSQCKDCVKKKHKNYRSNRFLYKKANPEEKLDILQDVWKELNDKMSRGIL